MGAGRGGRPPQAQTKPFGTFLEQTLRSKLRETGTFRLIPRTLALIAVQRHTAASKSAKPSMRLQHGFFGGVPMVTPINPPSKLAHTPSFRASLGQLPLLGCGFGFGFGLGFGPGHVPQALERVKKRMFRTRNSAIDVFLKAISQTN